MKLVTARCSTWVLLFAALLSVSLHGKAAAPSLSPFLYKQLNTARSLMETESWEEAKLKLETLGGGDGECLCQGIDCPEPGPNRRAPGKPSGSAKAV